jgi:hypothetical protein
MDHFEDIQKGDLIRVTNVVGDTLSTVTGVAAYKTSFLSNDYWVTEEGIMLVTRLERGVITIVTKNASEGN